MAVKKKTTKVVKKAKTTVKKAKKVLKASELPKEDYIANLPVKRRRK